MADIRVRVGQENAIKVISSVSGSAGGKSITSINVIGGIASVTQLTVGGISTFSNSAYFSQYLYYAPYSDQYHIGGVAFFSPLGRLDSTPNAQLSSISETNFVLSTNNDGTPSWANVIDGGTY